MAKGNGKSKSKTTDTTNTNGANEGQLKAVDTLSVDIRDAVLAEFKALPKPWQQMTEDEQERCINRARDIADQLVLGAVDLIAARGLPALAIQVGKLTIEGAECKGAFECYADDENLLRIRHLQGARAMFVLASPDAYSGESRPAETEVVGDLAMPKTGPGAPSDPAALATIGRGRNANGQAANA